MLGDLVGYGADPNAVIDRVRALPIAAIIRGNHDKVAAGLEDVEGFNHLARQAIEWTAAALTPENRAGSPRCRRARSSSTISRRSATARRSTRTCTSSTNRCRARADGRAAPLCLFGHTHVPAIFGSESRRRQRCACAATGRELDGTVPVRVPVPPRPRRRSQYLVNCGAVGQPRDGDPRAAFGMLRHRGAHADDHADAYDVATAQAKIIEAGLPEVWRSGWPSGGNQRRALPRASGNR